MSREMEWELDLVSREILFIVVLWREKLFPHICLRMIQLEKSDEIEEK